MKVWLSSRNFCTLKSSSAIMIRGLMILLLVACAGNGEITAPDSDVSLSGQFTLSPGQTRHVQGPDLSVRFVRLVGDSRCPSGVQCVWEGDGEIELELTRGEKRELVSLHTHQGPRFQSEVSFEGYRVRLLSLRPEPVHPPRPASEYLATLVVER